MNAVVKLCSAMAKPTRDSISRLEDEMHKLPTITPHVDHVFAKGAYMRCISMTKGTVITSKIHKTQHISVVVSGDVTISIPGETPKRVQGPTVFVTEAGTKRAIIVHEDTVWMTFHVTDETNLAKLEASIIAKTYEEAE